MRAMGKGFFWGTLILAGLYVVVQPGASAKTEVASNVFVQSLRRLFSPQVAGIGDHSKTSATGGTGTGTPNPSQDETAFGKLFSV